MVLNPTLFKMLFVCNYYLLCILLQYNFFACYTLYPIYSRAGSLDALRVEGHNSANAALCHGAIARN